MNSNAASAYQNAQFENAPPIKILQMLNAGAIRYLKIAQATDVKSADYRKHLRMAEEIIGELRASLDHEPNPDLSANLEGLYIFMQDELGRSLLEEDPRGIVNAIRIMETLLDAWRGANLQHEETPGAEGLHNAG
ncbi:MAG: flagellar protein FliS [Candidatus Paceibacteria bacterium]|jgi:flagellar protein FliS